MQHASSFVPRSLFRHPAFVACVAASFLPASLYAGDAVAWGRNSSGKLGNNTIPYGSFSSSPIPVLNFSGGVSAVAVGESHTLAIRDGGLFAWGSNGSRQLGNTGVNTSTVVPVPVTGLGSGVTAIAAGRLYSLAVVNGAAYAWGYNWDGQLGNGASGNGINSPEPVAVVGLSSGVTAVAGGGARSLAIRNGALYAWGDNTQGRLGDGTLNDSTVPIAISSLPDGVTAISAASFHCLAVRNGAAYAWGDDAHGKLGNGPDFGDSRVPMAVSGLTSGVTAVAAGDNHSLAIRHGNVYAWGLNTSGQLGNGIVYSSQVPILVLDSPIPFIAVAAGGVCSFALSSDGSIWSWGYNSDGRLGLGFAGPDQSTPQRILPPAGYKFVAITAHAYGDHAAAILHPLAPPCPADLNADTFVDDSDFVLFLASYNILDCADPSMPSACPADFDQSGTVDDADFVLFVPAYNELVCP